MARKKEKTPVYNTLIVAIDEDIEKKLNAKLIEGITEGLKDSIFGCLEIEQTADPDEKESLINDMFDTCRYEHFAFEGEEDDDFFFDDGDNKMFRPKDKIKVQRALNGKKDIYIGFVNFTMADDTVANILNDIVDAMEKSDKTHFKVIQSLKFKYEYL